MITQSHLPFTPWADPALARMPGMLPVEGPWVCVDDAYGAQMAERARLMAAMRQDVLQVLPGTDAICAEALDAVLSSLPDGFQRDGDHISRPDGVRISLDGAPLEILSTLIQEDILLLEKRGEEHVLVAGLLCFPASWTLAEKIGRPLGRIHGPVAEYDDDLAHRVQRMFDRLPPGRPLWRANALGYADPALHQPRPEDAPRNDAVPRYLRSERQTVLKLPRTGAILFAVHSWVVPFDRLTPHQRETCPFLPSA